MSIDSTFSFLFIDKQNQNIRLLRLDVFVHTHLTCSKCLSFFGLECKCDYAVHACDVLIR